MEDSWEGEDGCGRTDVGVRMWKDGDRTVGAWGWC